MPTHLPPPPLPPRTPPPTHTHTHTHTRACARVLKGMQLGHLDERRGEEVGGGVGEGGTKKTCIVNDILSALDNGNISVLLLFDLSAAFGTTDHQILLSRVNSLLSIQSTALQ